MIELIVGTVVTYAWLAFVYVFAWRFAKSFATALASGVAVISISVGYMLLVTYANLQCFASEWLPIESAVFGVASLVYVVYRNAPRMEKRK